jgi:cytoskeletal protein CcmA (bactofilin family)
MFSKQGKPGATGLTAVLNEAGPGLAPTTSPSSASPPPLRGPAGARKGGPKVASLIADDIAIEGNLRGEGELQVDGVIRGDVAVSRLTVGESGQIEGSVQADSVEVRGRVAGAITAKQVRLHASAHVDGDITHEQLTIDAGAFFEGRSLRFQRAAIPLAAGGDVIDISAAS